MKWMVALAAAILPGAAVAGSYRVVLAPPAMGKILIGHGGVQAVDDRTANTLVRLITPGNEVRERGTVRVLVMNLGPRPFEFGPEQVTLRLGDGTELKPVPVETMEKGRMLVERENRRAAAIDLSIKVNLGALADQAAMGATPQSIASVSTHSQSGNGPGLGQERRGGEFELPGGETLNAIYQILVPLTVGTRQAWGGYYVFDVPKAVQERKADQPLTVLVRTGAEEHRFAATLRWK